MKLKNLQELQSFDGDKIVVAGSEEFQGIPGGYESIPPRTPPKKQQNPDEEESYLKKNKKKYGGEPRSEEQKIYNRPSKANEQTKKFTIYRSGDEKFK